MHPAAPSPLPSPIGRSPKVPCIALAEDDPSFRQLIAQAIRAEGYEVVELRNGTELLEYVAATKLYGFRYAKPALIITDLRMPGFNGLEVIAGLRQARYRAPIILITAFGATETHARAYELGVIQVFDKPFDIDELCSTVSRMIPIRFVRRGDNNDSR